MGDGYFLHTNKTGLLVSFYDQRPACKSIVDYKYAMQTPEGLVSETVRAAAKMPSPLLHNRCPQKNIFLTGGVPTLSPMFGTLAVV